MIFEEVTNMMDPQFFNILMSKDLMDRDKKMQEQANQNNAMGNNSYLNNQPNNNLDDMFDWTKKKW